MPEGYAISTVKENSDGFDIEYVNEKGVFYALHFYDTVHDGAVDTEGCIISDIQISGHAAKLIVKKDRIMILWMVSGHEYELTGYISKEEAVKILESVKIN